jgi:hypothetical protein
MVTILALGKSTKFLRTVYDIGLYQEMGYGRRWNHFQIFKVVLNPADSISWAYHFYHYQ